MSGDETLDDYIYWLANDPDPEVRRNAAWRLGRLRDARVIEPLLQATSDPHAEVRVRVLEALGSLHQATAQVVPALIAGLQDQDEDVRLQAVRSLGNLGDDRAVQPLIRLLHDPEPALRSEAADALGSLDAPAAVAPLIERLLEDEDANVRYTAASSLAVMAGAQPARALAAALEEETDPARLVRLIETLARTRDPQAVAPIRRYEQHEDAGVREMAAWALSTFER